MESIQEYSKEKSSRLSTSTAKRSKGFWHRYWDLVMMIGGCLVIAAMLHSGYRSAIRLLLAVVFTFFMPGYVFLATLYPDRMSLGRIPRLAASVGVSAVVAGLIQMPMVYSLSSSDGSRVWALTVWIAAFALVAGYRRRSVLTPDRSTIQLSMPTSMWQRMSLTGRTLLIAQIGAVLFLGLALFRLVWVSNNTRPQFTEFYLLDVSGSADKYPNYVFRHSPIAAASDGVNHESARVADEPATVIVGVANHEHKTIQYRIEVVENTSAHHVADISLGHEQKWEQPYFFAIAKPEEDRKVTFLLYKGDDRVPHRSLHLWITVRER